MVFPFESSCTANFHSNPTNKKPMHTGTPMTQETSIFLPFHYPLILSIGYHYPLSTGYEYYSHWFSLNKTIQRFWGFPMVFLWFSYGFPMVWSILFWVLGTIPWNPRFSADLDTGISTQGSRHQAVGHLIHHAAGKLHAVHRLAICVCEHTSWWRDYIMNLAHLVSRDIMCMCVYVYIYIYTCIYICVYVCIYTYIYIYT